MHRFLKMKTGSYFKILILSTAVVLASSCQVKNRLDKVSGNVQVRIADSSSKDGALQTVTLKNISSLETFSGSYAEFFYSPGTVTDGLKGHHPRAHFIKNKSGVYIPADDLTLEMATVYYHIQNLTDLNVEVSPSLATGKPMQIGVNTLTTSAEKTLNNAFFDGDTGAILIVPYSLKNLPISVNAGILAHEFFHSVFYKLVLESFMAKSKAFSAEADADTDLSLYNDTYVRGLNEGLADFWGWLYTHQDNYIKISLPQVDISRKLELPEVQEGTYETEKIIQSRVAEASLYGDQAGSYLSSYIYKIGTPHARFLKTLTEKIAAENKIDLKESQMQVAKAVYKFMLQMNQQILMQKKQEPLGAGSLFKFFLDSQKSGLKLSDDQMEFVKKYK